MHGCKKALVHNLYMRVIMTGLWWGLGRVELYQKQCWLLHNYLTKSHKVKFQELAKLSPPVGQLIENFWFDFSIRQKGLLLYLKT
jgi:hypothetical protein